MVINSKTCYVFPIFLFFSISFKTYICRAANSISQGQVLTGNQSIISQDGKFELGFFTPGTSHHYYIGIWYKKIPKFTVVWVANRETPLPDTSYTLEISQDGNLLLTNQSNIQIWSTNSASATSNSTVLELLDSGNLVLRDGLNSSAIIWQSFDHPTDTWLPGAWLGWNKVTDKTQFLTSWKSLEDPSPGNFSLEIDGNGSNQYYLLWNRSVEYWDSGVWNGKYFNLIPEMGGHYLFTFRYVHNENQNSFTYAPMDNSLITRFVLESSGQIKQFSWIERANAWNLFWTKPEQQCDVYSLCGAFGYCYQSAPPPCRCLQGFEPQSLKYWNLSDFSGGCVRKNPLQCTNNNSLLGERDEFFMMPNMELPENSQSIAGSSVRDCESACLINCSCTAYSYGNGCLIWDGDLIDLRQQSKGDSEGHILHLRVAASEIQDSTQKKKYTGVIIGAVSGAIALLIIVLVLIWRCQRRRLVITSKLVQGSLVPFRYRDLQIVTNNFSEKLGGGGFGSVFKGTLPDSTPIAVKKLEGERQGEKQFRSEVSTIGNIQHVNLVRLRGFCSRGAKRLLVYEYMPNGSLDSHLFCGALDWKTRYQIALGTARALAYLHESCRECIIHCDIKPENVLLDAEFCPKVSDFGLAKILGRDFSRVLTTFRGTRGYLAPEWLAGLPITSKADVYSYGMMLFEIISGRRNSGEHEDGIVEFFPSLAVKKIIKDEVLSLLDYRLEGVADMEELTRACRIACWCVQDNENYRPSMGHVFQILESCLEVIMPPIPRSLQVFAETEGNISFFVESSSRRSSEAQGDVSITSLVKSTSSATDSK